MHTSGPCPGGVLRLSPPYANVTRPLPPSSPSPAPLPLLSLLSWLSHRPRHGPLTRLYDHGIPIHPPPPTLTVSGAFPVTSPRTSRSAQLASTHGRTECQ